MKKYILSFLLLLSILSVYAQDPAYPVPAAAPQVINAAEYFIDNDPGLGVGTPVTVTPGVNIAALPVNININGLSNGAHYLVIRVRNADGAWSVVSVRQFLYDADFPYTTVAPAPQQIVAAEYFIDADPGVGNGTAVSVTAGIDIAGMNVTVNTASLTNGIHRLYLRTKSVEGKWGIVAYREFLVDFNPGYPIALQPAGNLLSAEYFFDTDPGFGNGQPISVGAVTEAANINTALNTSGLSLGTHRVYIRAKNMAGSWTVVGFREFIVEDAVPYPLAPVAADNVMAAEYFIDTDPGFGRGNAITVTPALQLAGINVAANTAGLSQGVHRLYIRTKSNEGRWSVVSARDFEVSGDYTYPQAPAAVTNMVKAEYFIDTDPGYGGGTPITVTAATDIQDIPVAVSTNGLANGEHHLYVRTLNADGKWSVVSHAKFVTDLVSLTPDTLRYNNVVTGGTKTLAVTVANNSSTVQTINAITINGAFATTATAPVSLPANSNTTIDVSFTPTAAGQFIDSILLQTTTGKYKTVLTGTGITAVSSWALTPAAGHHYGNIVVGNTANFNFSITNTGNTAITLQNITSADAAFVPSFAAGTVIAAGASYNFNVGFTPAAVRAYQSQLLVSAATSGVTAITTQLQGGGYNPGTPPGISYITAAPYTAINGVAPFVGQTGDYVYKVLYQSANNLPPQAGYPKVGIDLNGNQTFTDINEGEFVMQAESTGTDYVTGVVYTYTFTHQQLTSQAGYKFTAYDQNGNLATGTGTAYKSGPVVTNDQVDLRLFANDISFSNANPLPGQAFTLTARISNSSAVPATNVPIRLYRDTIPLMDLVLPAIGAYGTATITQTLNFAAEGFYPIKVWVDSLNTIGDINPLNNYAIRPVIVGNPPMPGKIDVKVKAVVQRCPQLSVIISGTAVYDGTSTATNVAGATVTIQAGGQVITTTTDVNGYFSYVLTGVTCGGNFEYKATVTDYTLTGTTLLQAEAVPCPTANECLPPVPPPSQGGVVTTGTTNGCQNTVGNNAGINIKLKYRERNISNFWSSWDEVINSVLRIYVDGVLVETITSADGSRAPGEEVIVPYQVPLNSTAPVNVSAVLTYTYVEYLQIPDNFYHGIRTNHTATGNLPITPLPNAPDLNIQSFVQTDMVSFRFNNVNMNCPAAGAHTVRVYDSIPNGSSTLIRTYNEWGIAGKTYNTLSYTDPSITPGTHIIKIVTDYDGVVTEENENNNTAIFTMVVPAPDFSVGEINLVNSDVAAGGTTKVTAIIRNRGKLTGAFNVRFSLAGNPIGSLVLVPGIGSNDSILVESNAFIVNNAANLCGGVITVVADALSAIAESDETNNTGTKQLASDITPLILPHELGSTGRPVVVRVNTMNQFFPAVRNMGIRDAGNVSVKYVLNGNWIGNGVIQTIKAGSAYVAYGSFSHEFTVPGNYVVRVIADTANLICEADETNNEGNFYIRVVDSKPDLEVLSQYISPSSLNPNPNQTFTIVGTVRNSGGKPSTASSLRFMVENMVLGADIPINAIQPGKDTTVAATVGYAGTTAGIKVLRLIADPLNQVDEEIETNNEATRTIIIGDAPDIAPVAVNPISFNPSGFVAGDMVTVRYEIRNYGTQPTSGWVRFTIRDEDSTVIAIDSVAFGTLAPGNTIPVSRTMLIAVAKGTVTAQVYNCAIMEYNVLNNDAVLPFDKVMPLRSNLIVAGDLDMELGLPEQLPGWIGGKLVLGDYNLTVNGNILNADSAHFIVTNGMGKLTLVNSLAMNTYPVGTAITSPNFVELNNTGTQDNFSVRVVPYVLQRGNSGDTIRVANVNRTWFINEQVSGGSNVAATFYWSESHELPGFDRPQSRTAHYTSKWELGALGNAVLHASGQFTKTQAGFTGFSPFTITSGSGSALPLQLLSFKAVAQPVNVLLQWKTTNEVNTKQFTVEHSTDGVRFVSIGTVQAANTAGINAYTFTDHAVNRGIQYYRLKMEDIDGTYTYSNIETVNRESALIVSVYPNPVQNSLYIKNLPQGAPVKLLGINGAVLKQLKADGTLTIIDVQQLPAGTYIVQYVEGGKLQQHKIVKQ
jgi:subtilase family serine protease